MTNDEPRGNNGPPKILPFRAANVEVQDAASVLMLWAAFLVRHEASDGGLPIDPERPNVASESAP
jgi:hypothetical protein